MAYSETRRQVVHIAMVGWAFLLRALEWPQAAALAAAALAFNAFLLPRAGGRVILRPEDAAHGVAPGILFYPFSVLLLILLFRSRLDIVATSWAILAVGDGAATIAGRRAGIRRLPWNRDKTWAGTAAFAVLGGAAAVLLCWWTQPGLSTPAPAWFVFGAPWLAAIAAALVETIPVRLDDNLSVPFAAAATLWVASLADATTVQIMAGGAAGRLLPALAVNAGFATVAYLEGAVTRPGAIAGALIGVTVYLGAGWEGWLLLCSAFACAVVTSKTGWRRKALLGIAEEHEGRRGAGNALANCLVAAIAALVALTSPYQDAAWLALVTALTAGAADTVASEIGKVWGRQTVLVIGFRPVPPGTPGAISLEGTIANIVAAFGLAGLGAALGLISSAAVPLVACAALAGAFAESVLAATLEKPGILNNDLLNFLNTAVAVAVGLWVGSDVWDMRL
ncbi:MAG: DUF92 domain-containing protein [Vicinamibacterales bacterium]